ncbi:MAG: hypothetical protein NTU89_01615 [Candidatus Dependentiae bacterium]|nr:hypothetical protein [Candidatus Dependentiae bacterium]
MKFQNKYRVVSAILVVSGLTLFSGCAWWPFGGSSSKEESTKSESASNVLLSINGTPALTVEKYEEQLEMAKQANPQIGMLLQMMPNAEKDFIFRGMATAEMMKAWAKKEGIDKTEDFKKQRDQLCDAMELQLYMKHFDEAHPVNISDADLSSFYEEQKDVIPALTLSPGGVETVYVRFDSKDKADKFFDKVKDIKKASAFKAAAQQHDHKAGDSVINEKSQVGDSIKSVVLDLKKFPSVRIVGAGDNSYWVLFASGKSDTKYRDLKTPEVQHGLKKMLTDQRKDKQIESVVNKLKTEMNVVENHKYFEDKENAKRASIEESQKGMQQESSDDLDMVK